MGRGSKTLKKRTFTAADLLNGATPRGVIARNEPAPRKPAPATGPRSDEDIFRYFDADALARRRAPLSLPGNMQGAVYLACSARLEAPSSSGGKAYRGWIAVRPGADGSELVGLITHGKVSTPDAQSKIVAAGKALEQTIRAVNERLEQKLSGKKSSSVYSPVAGTGPDLLDVDEVYRQIQELL